VTVIAKWARAAESVGLVTSTSADDPGVLLLYATDTETGRFPSKIGLIVIRDESVTYAELDGHVFDSITSDQRPLHVQLAEALKARA
jgi:hypothetical protein